VNGGGIVIGNNWVEYGQVSESWLKRDVSRDVAS
jgi:hypothetical protein